MLCILERLSSILEVLELNVEGFGAVSCTMINKSSDCQKGGVDTVKVTRLLTLLSGGVERQWIYLVQRDSM